MKKFLTSLALILCSVIVCSVCACGTDNTEQYEDLKNRIDSLESANGSLQDKIDTLESDIDSLQDKIDALESANGSLQGKIDSLESANGSLQNKIDSLESAKPNVFWTDKEEYAQTETMTVYYGNRAVFEIKLRENDPWSETNAEYINGGFLIKSLMADIVGVSLVKTAYIVYDGKTAMNVSSYGGDSGIFRKDIESSIGGAYNCKLNDVLNAKDVKFAICVPGTPFPMAYFKITKITVH